ncbi:carboxymuconolactone decarboxylase family protein [Halobacillus sp. A5]|uniref:carboxymuconolactone decarboxylase family protein n=1 Tax=Halobacillus sp. A5 TaxID=2880263 RepID=UPI0020A66C16|nr:carboxymuconolactone decarboxylase family protein [Halobacillus sp. A5]MCP3027970.1 carboxymuconolactone decarboxylase family protein [Halobacillus sp. A5]
MTNDTLYRKSYFSRLPELGDLAPEAFKAFIEFDQKAMARGKLSTKQKEIIAIAVAHTTGCPYCIEVHVNNAKKQDVTKEEMSESIFVAAALKAGSAAAHGVNALNAYDNGADKDLYQKQYFNRIKEFSELSGDAFEGFVDFDKKAMKAGKLSAKEKELTAVAVAHTTGCPYCIEIHTEGAKSQGASKEEVAESIFVATALKAGSAIAHSVNALNAYDAE